MSLARLVRQASHEFSLLAGIMAVTMEMMMATTTPRMATHNVPRSRRRRN